MPGFQIGTHRTLALATLIDCHCRVVDNLEEWHNSLRLAIRSLDVSTERTHRSPIVAQTTGIFGQQRVFLDSLVNTVQIIRHGSQIARGKLRALRTGIKQSWRRAHEIKTRQQTIKLYRARLTINLI